MDMRHISGYAALLVGLVWLFTLLSRFSASRARRLQAVESGTAVPAPKRDWSWDVIGVLTLVVGASQLGFDVWAFFHSGK